MKTNEIIIQDIDHDIREILRLVLEDNNYKVLALSNCPDIKDHIAHFNPQVILLNFRITGQDIITSLKEIKALFPQLPVIAKSGNGKIIETYK
jgi:DNA-binding NtrC family response regulator